MTPKDLTVCTPDNRDQPFVFFLGIPWFTYQEQFDSQIRLPIMRQVDAGGLFDLYLARSVIPRFLSDLERKRGSMPFPAVSDLTQLVSHEHGYRSNASKGPTWEVSNVRTGVEIVQVMTFMSSNNLSFHDHIDHFLEFMIDRGLRWALKLILSPKSPTSEIFATKLLQSACRIDDSEAIHLFLSCGADPNAQNPYWESPLFLAVENGCISTVKLLIEHGAEIDPPTDLLKYYSVLDNRSEAVSSTNSIEMVQLLLKAGAVVTSRALTAAVASSNIELVEVMLDAEAHDVQRISGTNRFGTEFKHLRMTALRFAAKNNYLGMVRRLLINYGDVNFPNTFIFKKVTLTRSGVIQDECMSPLVYAVRNGNFKMIEALLDAGADINFVPGLECKQNTWSLAIEYAQKTEQNETRRYLRQITNTALQTAAYHGNLELVQFLLAAGASADTYHYGDTALQIAAKRNNVPLVRILLAHGASVYASANWPFGRTALQAASENGNLSMIDLLLGTIPRASWIDILNMPPCEIGGRNAFQAAAERGHLSTVKYLLRLGVNINGLNAYLHGATVLQAAVRSRNLQMANLVLAAGAETGTPPGTTSAFAIAIEQHDSSMFELLFNHAANFYSAPNKDERPVLQKAAEQESSYFLEKLIQAGWNVNEIWKYEHPESAIGRAIQRGRIANVELLLLAGADPQRALVTDLDHIDTELLKLLLGHGADPNMVAEDLYDFPYHFTPLARVVSSTNRLTAADKLPIAKTLLGAGAVVDCQSSYGSMSVLALAVCLKDIELCKLMLTADADPNWRYHTDDVTALECAASRDSDEIFYMLISAGADANVPNTQKNMTALQRAASCQNLDFVRTLLKLGAHVNASPGYHDSNDLLTISDHCDDFYWSATALQVACLRNNDEIIDTLLGAGADINAPAGTYYGRTALQAAASIGHLERVQMLLQKGADINSPASREGGFTALQAASIGGHLAIVVLLLHVGADINGLKSSRHGRTALEGAAEHGRLDVVQLLLENDHDMEGFYDRCNFAATFAEKEGHKVIARILRNYRKD